MNKDKVVLITGGSRGIGRRTAIEFSKEGYTVLINYRQNDQFTKEFVHELKEKYCNTVYAVKGDISIPKECDQIVDTI